MTTNSTTQQQAGSYATDGKCHNAEPGTYGHECGRPALWIGTKVSGFRAGWLADLVPPARREPATVMIPPGFVLVDVVLPMHRAFIAKRWAVEAMAKIKAINSTN